MVMYSFNGEEHSIETDLALNLDTLKRMVENDWDGLLFVFGREGVGKSTFALQVAAYLDPKFCIDKIAWTPEQFLHKVKTAKQYDCIVLDEAYMTFTNTKRMDHLQRVIIGMLTMIRSKNLYIVVVSPTFFDLSKYLIVHRSLAAFRCYHEELQRGYFDMYDERAKLKLYIRGRKDNDIHAVEPTLHGRFTKWFPVSVEEYKSRKDSAVLLLGKDLEKEQFRYDMKAFRDGQDEVIGYLRDVVELFKRGESRGLFTKLAQHLGITLEALERRVTKYQKGKQKLENAKRNSLSDSLIARNYEVEDLDLENGE